MDFSEGRTGWEALDAPRREGGDPGAGPL